MVLYTYVMCLCFLASSRIPQSILKRQTPHFEVVLSQVAVVMAEARATRAKRGARESVISLASARGDADEMTWKVTLLEGELAVTCETWDMDESKVPGLTDRAVDISLAYV
jgi:hypothetical protein